MIIQNYKDLVVWQKAMDLVFEVYQISKSFPRDEQYALANQIRRAAVSVPSNIAEGRSRYSSAEFRNFLSVAHGSLAEVETQLLLAIRLNYTDELKARKALDLDNEISKMLVSLYKKIGI